MTTVLTERKPAVSLNRLQSGIGTVRIDATWPSADHFQIGCAYRMRSGYSTVRWPQGTPTPDGPIALSNRPGPQSIALDLLRCRKLDRLIVFVALAQPLPPTWTGALRIATYGGSVIEVPLDRPPVPEVMVLISISNLAGELVVRAEREGFAGTVRDAVLAYGFEQVAWSDNYTAR